MQPTMGWLLLLGKNVTEDSLRRPFSWKKKEKLILPTLALSSVVEDNLGPYESFWLWWWQAGAGEQSVV